jgi:hypothetical protein
MPVHAGAQCPWDLFVSPWHLDEEIEGFPVPAGATVLAGPPDSAVSELDSLTGRFGHTADAVAQVDHPLVLAGDCLTALGLVAGLQRRHRDVSVIWLDAHGDFNTSAACIACAWTPDRIADEATARAITRLASVIGAELDWSVAGAGRD